MSAICSLFISTAQDVIFNKECDWLQLLVILMQTQCHQSVQENKRKISCSLHIYSQPSILFSNPNPISRVLFRLPQLFTCISNQRLLLHLILPTFPSPTQLTFFKSDFISLLALLHFSPILSLPLGFLKILCNSTLISIDVLDLQPHVSAAESVWWFHVPALPD